jgi:toxin ParE1/3/4
VFRVVWRERASDDLERVVEYIAEHHPAAAVRMQDRFERCAERLADHPFIHRRGRVADTREAVVHPNYIMVYRVGADDVEILSIHHARQSYP